MARREVRVGQRYVSVTSEWCGWEVARVYQDRLGFPHAVIVNVVDSTTIKTLACSTLLDQRRYRLIQQDLPSEMADHPEPWARAS